MPLIATRVRGLPSTAALDRAIASGRYRTEQERTLRVLARNRALEVAELERPLSPFMERDENGHVADFETYI